MIAVGTNNNYMRVYAWDGSSYAQRQNLNGEQSSGSESFGFTVALSSDGSILAVGAYQNDVGGSRTDAGSVRVYAWDSSAGGYVQRGSDIDGAVAGDEFGYSIALSADGSILVVGARFADGGGSNRGTTYAFAWDGSAYSARATGGSTVVLHGAANSDNCGFAVAVSSDGNTLATSSPTGENGMNNQGIVYIYEWQSGSWTQKAGPAYGAANADRAGQSVALNSDGTVIAIGAKRHANNLGHVRVFAYASSAWSQLGSDLDGEDVDENFGHSISLSADGLTIAVGAHKNNDGGENAGSARTFTYSSGSWSQLGSDIDGSAQFLKLGSAIALSGDGTTLVIGAKSGANSPGSAYVYTKPNPPAPPPSPPPPSPPPSPPPAPPPSPPPPSPPPPHHRHHHHHRRRLAAAADSAFTLRATDRDRSVERGDDPPSTAYGGASSRAVASSTPSNNWNSNTCTHTNDEAGAYWR